MQQLHNPRPFPTCILFFPACSTVFPLHFSSLPRDRRRRNLSWERDGHTEWACARACVRARMCVRASRTHLVQDITGCMKDVTPSGFSFWFSMFDNLGKKCFSEKAWNSTRIIRETSPLDVYPYKLSLPKKVVEWLLIRCKPSLLSLE